MKLSLDLAETVLVLADRQNRVQVLIANLETFTPMEAATVVCTADLIMHHVRAEVAEAEVVQVYTEVPLSP